jgi:hypothetical protein
LLSKVKVRLAARSTSARVGQTLDTASWKRTSPALAEQFITGYLCGKRPGVMSEAATVPSLPLGLPCLIHLLNGIRKGALKNMHQTTLPTKLEILSQYRKTLTIPWVLFGNARMAKLGHGVELKVMLLVLNMEERHGKRLGTVKVRCLPRLRPRR